MEIPSTPWREQPWLWASARRHAPCDTDWRRVEGSVTHTFTHFHLRIDVAIGRSAGEDVDGLWCLPEHISRHALSTAMKKVVAHVFGRRTGAVVHPGHGDAVST